MSMVSIIIPCKNEGELIRQTIESILVTPSQIPYGITVVNDGSTDGCCSFLQGRRRFHSGVRLINTKGIGAANARNIGAEESPGDILVFCDAHITVEEGWLEALVEGIENRGAGAVSPGIATMNNPGAIGYGFTWNEKLETVWLPSTGYVAEIPFAPGGCLAVSRKVFEQVGGFERGFRIYGYEDAEFSLKLWLFGHRVEVDPRVIVKHYFRISHPYRITITDYAYNALRMAFSHFNTERIGKVINFYSGMENIGQIITELLLESNVMEQRERYLILRRYDDNWFMNKFGIVVKG